MNWLVNFNLSCHPEAGRLTIVVQGLPDESAVERLMETFYPHAFDVNVRPMRGHLVGVFIADLDVKVMQPKPPNPFSNN